MDANVRLRAFEWLQELTAAQGDVLSWQVLQQGFMFSGKRIAVLGQQGIWKPAALELPLSIRTSVNSPYGDRFSGDHLLLYDYQGTDPNHWNNRGLREVMRQGVPLIYFHGVTVGQYLAVWPVFIVGDDPASLTFTVAADDAYVAQEPELWPRAAEEDHRRRYITAAVKTRLHQRSFRARVLDAYGEQCAFCQLRHRELLDAAHIIADGDLGGEPMVKNGLALCKIHHAAFDRHIVGVKPDYIIQVQQAVLEEVDGPMLKYGIQLLHGQPLLLPRRSIMRPDKERLAQRYEDFRRAM